MNPISYVGVAIAFSGISFFVMKNRFNDINLAIMGSYTDTPASRQILEMAAEYHAFIFLLFIPVIALAGMLSFNTRKYNLPEHLVSASYSMGHFSLVITPFTLFVLLILPGRYMQYSFINIALMFSYTLYTLVRLHPTSSWFLSTLRAFAYLILFCVGYLGLSITINLIALLTGMVELKDFLPQEP